LIEAQLPEELLLLQLYLDENGARRIVAEPKGSRYEELCKEIF
jgi:tRNA threonylcarbamoyladenosine biosynthesis protein TsaE